jgi:hypothetical protein
MLQRFVDFMDGLTSPPVGRLTLRLNPVVALRASAGRI